MATVKKTMMMMKKSSPKKAQTGKTVMQKLKMKYTDADTSAAGDTRFQEFNAYAPKKELKKIADTDKAFDKKYGKGKPAKNKMGGKVKKAPKKAMMGSSMMMEKPMMKSGGTLAPTKKSVGKTIGKLNKAKSGMKMSKMMSKMSKKK